MRFADDINVINSSDEVLENLQHDLNIILKHLENMTFEY